MEEKVVKMTAEEQQEFEAFKAEKAEKERKEQEKQNRKAYKEIVNETIERIFPELQEISAILKEKKGSVYKSFEQAISLKSDIYDVKEDQRSNTFTNTAGNKRIILGQHSIDYYDDTVNEGIAKVRKFISSLAKDENSTMLVNAIMRLLSKDKEGNLKASRVIQLSKMANESGNATFIDGVKIIQDAYQPAVSKFYVRAEYKDDKGEWKNVPLGMTEV